MKKILLLFACILPLLNIYSQDLGSLFLEKHGDDKSLDVINIGKTMLSLVQTMAPDAETQEALNGIDKIRIISSDSIKSDKYFKSAYEMLTKKNSGFESLISMKGDHQNVCVMVKKVDGVAKDLVLLNKEGKGFNLICISGDSINLKVLSKLSQKVKIDGLDKLKNLDTKDTKDK